MDNNDYLTWEEIQTKYPDSWVSIIESSVSDDEIKGGIVIASNKNNNKLAEATKKLINEASKINGLAIVYTGEIPYIAGLSRLEMYNV